MYLQGKERKDKDNDMEIKNEYDFYDLQNACWSGAEDTLKIVEENDMEEELMNFLESYFGEFGTPTMTEVNDLLWFESDWIFEQIGLDTEEEDEDDYWDDDEEEDEEDDSDSESEIEKIYVPLSEL